MAPRTSRRQRAQDSYTEESDDSSSKRRRSEKKTQVDIKAEMDSYEDDIEYKEAIEALEKKRENLLLLIHTELRMRLENANTQAAFEEKRINQFYEDQVAELKRRVSEEQKTKTRSMTAEAQIRQHRMVSHKFDMNPMSPPTLSKKDQPGFTVQLTEEEIVDDLLYMARDWARVCEEHHLEKSCTAVPLSYNRLLLNDHVIYPNTPCTVMSGGNRLYDCIFAATVVKEKEGKEKKKEPEFVLKVSATRKRRYPIDSLRTGEMELVFQSEDLQSTNVENKANNPDNEVPDDDIRDSD
ncbi:hypothetical protein WA171_000015 [Blastocystis sp. BT1]